MTKVITGRPDDGAVDLLNAHLTAQEHEREMAVLRADLAAMTLEARRARHLLEEIEASTLWRLTAPLRGGAQHVPKTVHRLVRRVHRGAVTVLSSLRRRSGAEGVVAVGGHAPIPRGVYRYRPPERGLDVEGASALAALARADGGPVFSVIVVLAVPTPGRVMRVIAGLKRQWPAGPGMAWEAVIALAGEEGAAIEAMVAGLGDPALRVVRAGAPEDVEAGALARGASACALARALEAARGTWVLFHPEDGVLAENALAAFARALAAVPADLAYADEAYCTASGEEVPLFKPDWSPDTVLALNYIGRCFVVRRAALLAVGGVDPAAVDGVLWDLLLRVTERAGGDSGGMAGAVALHVPEVLIRHDREPEAEPGVVVRERALARRGIAGWLEPVAGLPGYHQLRYAVSGAPLISVIIPTRDHGAILHRNIEALRTVNRWAAFEVIVVDNGSRDRETCALLAAMAALPEVRVVRHDAPFNFSELNRVGVAAARGDLLLFLNDDMEVVSSDALERMAGFAQQPHIGAVGAKLLYPADRTVQHVGIFNGGYGPVHALAGMAAAEAGPSLRGALTYDWSSVTGACLMIARATYERVGGFDEALPVAYNDTDLCLRLLAAGLFNVVTPAAVFLHYESLSRREDDDRAARRARLAADRAVLTARHAAVLAQDPFHNPNYDPHSAFFAPRV